MKHIDLIKNKISAKKLTIEDVAKKANVTRAHLYAVLRGSTPITAKVALDLGETLGLNGKAIYLADAKERYERLLK